MQRPLIARPDVALPERRTTSEGLEASVATNVVSHFLLTNLLLDMMQDSAPARIINVSSNAHSRPGHINFDDLGYQRLEASSAVEAMGLRVSRCQLGCFPRPWKG